MNVFVLTGAGISAESGLPTLRDPDGLWERYSPHDLATPVAFARDPALVRRFYDARRRALRDAAPNTAHVALARLCTELPKRGGGLFPCTQNVDDLHERGGGAQVLHMHGELRKARCTACGRVLPFDGAMEHDADCPSCAAADALRPHVVWFGEEPLGLEEIGRALDNADVFAAIGTSGTVYPAADFVRQARDAGVRTVELNLEPSAVAGLFDNRRIGAATETVPGGVDELLSGPDVRRRIRVRETHHEQAVEQAEIPHRSLVGAEAVAGDPLQRLPPPHEGVHLRRAPALGRS
jgi:NAD-dependent deacetylase